MGNGLDIDVFK